MKMVAIVGSLRKDSFNRKFVKSIQERYSNKFKLEIVEIASLPHYNQDDELNPPKVVSTFKKQVADSDGVIMVTPEYNWSIPGVLKNALDWLSRVDKELVNKPVMTAGVSPGAMGTVRAQLHLRQVLSSPGISARVLPPGGNEVLINAAGEKFDANGQLVDEATLNLLDGVIDQFVSLVNEKKI